LWLETAPLTSGLIRQIFGVRYLSTLFGIVFFSHQIGAFLGVWMGGYIFEVTGSYDIVWYLSVVRGVLFALLYWPIMNNPLPDWPWPEKRAHRPRKNSKRAARRVPTIATP